MERITLKVIFLSLFLLFLLTACQKTTTFFGESNDWKVQYVSNVDDKNKGTYDLLISYVGEEPKPELINYSYSIPNKYNEEVKNIPLYEGTIHEEKTPCEDCGVQDIGKINFNIEYNEKAETISLERQ